MEPVAILFLAGTADVPVYQPCTPQEFFSYRKLRSLYKNPPGDCIAAERMGWSSYGDKQYVPHVLRYYIFGRIPTGSQAIVQVALTQEGNSGDTYWSWCGFDSRVEWCACPWKFQDASYVPAVGDIIFFDWENDGIKDHVGIREVGSKV